MPAVPDEVRAVIVRYERPCFWARLEDGSELRVTHDCIERVVVGMRVIVWRLHATRRGLEGRRLELDEAHRAEYEALLLAEIEHECLERARAEKRPPQAPLLPGQHRGVIEEPAGHAGKDVRLDDGRVARSYSSGKFRESAGVRVIVRRLEERRGVLWVAEVELDEEHREEYERTAARPLFERALDDARLKRERRGPVASELSASAVAVIVVADKRAGVLALEDGTHVAFGLGCCDGFEPGQGMRVTASRFRRRPDGTLWAEQISIDEATRAAALDAKRARRRETAEAAPGEPTLEAAILDRPDDDAALAAYQVWLAERGDVRAELMAIDGAIEKAAPADAAELGARRQELLARNAAYLLGPFADGGAGVELSFRRGFIRSARIGRGFAGAADRVGALLSLPTARLLRELVVESGDTAVMNALARLGSASVERLVLGEGPAASIADVSRLGRACPRLVDLELAGTGIAIEPARFPQLRRLVVRSVDIGRAAIEALAAAELPELETLVLWIGQIDEHDAEANEIRARELLPFLAGERLPKLRELGLCNTTLTNELCRALPGSGVLPRLRRLDLSQGTMTDGGAAAIGSAASAFAHLAALDARANLLTSLGEGYLREAVASAATDAQRPGYGQGRRDVAVAS